MFKYYIIVFGGMGGLSKNYDRDDALGRGGLSQNDDVLTH